jgi:hypothetical protein
MTGGVDRGIGWKTSHGDTLSTAKPISTGLGSHSGFHGEWSATDRLNHGTGLWWTTGMKFFVLDFLPTAAGQSAMSVKPVFVLTTLPAVTALPLYVTASCGSRVREFRSCCGGVAVKQWHFARCPEGLQRISDTSWGVRRGCRELVLLREGYGGVAEN